MHQITAVVPGARRAGLNLLIPPQKGLMLTRQGVGGRAVECVRACCFGMQLMTVSSALSCYPCAHLQVLSL